MRSALPGTGLLFTCTLNTFMKTQMRFIFSTPMESSSGGQASSIKQTFPSAELIIKLESCGVFLSGSLKNQRVNNVSKKPKNDMGTQKKLMAVEKLKKIIANFHPSGWMKGLFLVNSFI